MAASASHDQRPWPAPTRPWWIAQAWSDLLFAHWRVDVKAVRALIPGGLELELWNNEAWLSVIPFHVALWPRGAPRLLAHRFLEVNVRTYVTRGGKPGIWFFSLDAASLAAVKGARAAFHLPYFQAEMKCSQPPAPFVYQSERVDRDARVSAEYGPAGPAFNAVPGSLEHWLVERYCLYATNPYGALERTEVDHPPWSLQPGEGRVEADSLIAAAGIPVPSSKPLLHFTNQQTVKTWFPERC